MTEYRIKFYKKSSSGEEPVRDYLDGLREAERAKILRFMEQLRVAGGRLPPYSKHIEGKIWELRIDFSPLDHRIFYITAFEKTIIFLHGFTKKTNRTPRKEIDRAERYCDEVLDNRNYYEKAN